MSNLNIKNDINLIEKDIKLESDFLNFGYGLFETIKIFKGNLEYIDEHLNRLFDSSKVVFSHLKLDIDRIKNDAEVFTKKNELEFGALKIILFKNNNEFDWIIKYNNRTYIKEKYDIGFKIRVSKFSKNEKSILAYHKTLNYMENIIEKRDALLSGYDESIYTNSKGNISEGTLSNIFIVKNGLVITPPLSSGILNGVIRKNIIKSSNKFDVQVIEKDFGFYELVNADEIFITNSLLEVMPIARVDNYNFNIKKFRITNKIMSIFNNYMEI
ncbi:aminotransferase class IV [Helicovermis profundi]|uniref:Aminotransferase class IV n=1 Tax=Helicovermis profundi TaxID=3065157 RepID=A0AAU9E534_9FIRM|nr:aminotransferase class IV [Clostridia bacterium S502]